MTIAGDHSPSQHDASAAEGHADLLRRWRWRDGVCIALGGWLIVCPAALGYRSAALAWSDGASGILVLALSAVALLPRFDWVRWGIAFVGLWLLLAPLVFWAPDAAAYNNDTAVGALLIVFSVVVPAIPGRTPYEIRRQPGPQTPPAWSYNPSDWIQRAPIVVMALVGFFISRYLASYQLGHIPYPWDPIFGDGTRRVLDSEVSKAFPVSDAGLGALTYLMEALSGLMGGRSRWRTMPWMVLLFGIMVVPLGVVSLVLVMLQPVAVGAWCTLCLVTAAAMLIMIAPAVDEVLATGQFLLAARREHRPLWRVLWIGGSVPAVADDVRPDARRRSWLGQLIGALDLDQVPWNLGVAALCGLWLMVSPAVLGVTGPAADSEHVAGALIITWSVVGFGQAPRSIRFLNVPVGLWLAGAGWQLSGATALSAGIDVAVGIAVIGLSLRRGPIEERFGGWNRYVL